MKKLYSSLCLFVLVFALQAQAPATRHVILISIDGMRPEFYLDPSWPTPNLRSLMKQGTYADHLKSVFPAYTYPSHTAMLTGALPARSGICFNQPKNSKGEWNWFMDSVKVPTLWKALRKAGLSTATVEWPVSVGKDIDYNIPEIWSIEHPGDRITEARKYATPGLIEEVEREATGRLDGYSMNDEYFSMDENASRAAAYIFAHYKPALLAVHFACVDGMEHEYGRDADSVRLALASADRSVGRLVEAVIRSGLRDSTVVIVVGDHGFSTINTAFRPNILIRDLPGKFIAAGGSAFLYRNADASPTGDAALIKSVREKLATLPKERRDLFRILDRKALDRMGADSSALLALAAVPGLVFSSSIKAAPVTNNGPGTSIQHDPLEGIFLPVHGGHHGYDPDEPQMYTGFIAAGSGIVKGGHIKELAEPDIAPLIARLLGIDFPTPDGRLVPGICN